MDALNLDGAAEQLAALRQEKPQQEQEREQQEEIQATDVQEESVVEEVKPERAKPQKAKEEAEQDAEEVLLDAEQLASLLGLEQDSIQINDEGGIRFRTKVDGEEGDATLKDLLERYQRDANLTNRGKELTELKKQAETQLQTLNQQVQQTIQQQEAMFSTLEKELLAPYDDINWRTLKEEDPTDYAIKRSEMSDIKDKLKSQRESAAKQIQEQYQYLQQQNQSQIQAYVAEQKQMLRDLIPEWNDSMQTEIRSYLKSEGIPDSEIDMIANAKWIKIINNARLFNQGKSEVKKKVTKTLPKVLRPSSQPSKQTVRDSQLNKLQDQFKKSGSMEDAAALLRAKFSKG